MCVCVCYRLLSSCPQGFLKGSLEALNYNNSFEKLLKISAPCKEIQISWGWVGRRKWCWSQNWLCRKLKENADGEGHAFYSYEKSFGSQVISFLGQSGSSSSISGHSSLCSVMCSVTLDYTSWIEAPSLTSNLQASLWNSGKEEDSVVHHLLRNHIISQGRRRGYNLGAALKRATYYVHLGELHLALPTCHLLTFFQVPKKHWGQHSFKQETGEATGFYPVCSATG